MVKSISLTLSPEEASTIERIKVAASHYLDVNFNDINQINIIKKSIDSRSKLPKVILHADVYIGEYPQYKYSNIFRYKSVENSPEIIIVGSGPAGLFAALRLIEFGLKPIILERGKEILERKKDIAQLNRNNSLEKDSNYCFGEGGAGTFSDGKLYSRSNKRGNIQRVLEIFHAHGAKDEILYEAHPHIGTDLLPQIIKNMRNHILDCGGEIHYNTCVSDFVIENNQIKGVKCANGISYNADNVILSTGHSARDIYYRLHQNGIALQAKGFAMGVRVEHPQSLIDSIQYHSKVKNPHLPAASYSLVNQVDGRGVYSFCMCPGGHIVPSATDTDLVVVNGMSASQRNSPYANSGIVVEIHPEDLPSEYQQYGELCGLKFQEDFERMAFNNNGGKFQTAPAQRLGDFVRGRVSYDLPQCSYLPGIISSPLHFWMPEIIRHRLQEGFKSFDKKMHGFLTNEAVILGVESRTSSPIRIPRNPDTLEHIHIGGLYPAGEGSGYAGGITSSAMDGEKCAEMIAQKLNRI